MRTDTTPTNEPLLPNEEAFDRYLAGECSAAEREALEGWLKAHPDVATRLKVVSYIAAHPVADMPRVGAAAAFEVFQNRSTRKQNRDRGRAKDQPLRRWGWSTAAVLLGLFGIVVSWQAGVRHTRQNTAMSMMIYTTGNGERATIALPDGGTVALNVASRLEVPADYTAGNHTVRLIGEALFTVGHQTGVPFTVIAGPTVTRVLGTSFVVRRYGVDTTTMVAVRDGKVAVGATVVPAARFMEVGSSGVGRVQPADESQFGFATGVLALRSMSLAEAIPELNRWYDADIRLGNASLATRPVKGYVRAGSLADLSELLSVAFDVRAVRNGRMLTLYAR